MSPASQNKGLRVLGCLVKTPLGCLAFFVGAIPVFVLFLPPACGNMTSQFIEDEFNRHHRGSLEVREAWLGSLYGPQKVESIVLRDPQGEEIFYARLTAPSFSDFFEGAHDLWGPVEVVIPRLVLREDAGGVTNFSRAIALQGETGERENLQIGGRDGLQLSYGELNLNPGTRAIRFLVTIDLLSWSDAAGNEIRVREIDCEGELSVHPEGVQWHLRGTGAIDGRSEGFRFDWLVQKIERLGQRGGYAPWSVTLELDQTPRELASALSEGFEVLAGVLDGELQRVKMTLDGSSPSDWRLEDLEIQTDATALQASGRWDRKADKLLAGRHDRISLYFPTESEVAGRLAALLPLAENPRLETADDRASLELTNYSIPLQGAVEEITADCVLNAAVAFDLPATVADELGISRTELLEGPVEFSLAEEEVHFESLTYPTAEGEVELFGLFDLEQGTYNMTLRHGEASFGIDGARSNPEIEAQDG